MGAFQGVLDVLEQRRKWAIVAAMGTVLVSLGWLVMGPAGTSQGGGAPDATVSIESATVGPGGNVVVDVTITPQQGITVGAMDVNVNYNAAVLHAASCSPSGGCNPAYDADTVRFAWADLSGLSGVEGMITFDAIGSSGQSSALDVEVLICVDGMGADLTCADSDGSIQISNATPTPGPSITPSPSPTVPPPTPTPPALMWGNVDCSAVIDAVDSLVIQRWKVGLTYNHAPGCPAIGSGTPPQQWGDVNCDGVVNAVDSLAIQRWKVALLVQQTQPCPVIGTPYP